MLSIIARTATSKLKIRKVMSKLFQSYVYGVLGEREHAGYRHQSSGKVFKSTAFRIRYFDNRFEIDFTALSPEHEKALAMAILRDGLKLGAVHFADTTVSIIDRHVASERLHVKGYVVAAVKNPATDQKIYLQPGDPKHTQIITAHSLQKYETLLCAAYEGALSIRVLHQSPKEMRFFYEKGPVSVWPARYEIEAEPQMLNLLLDTGLGGEGMKGLGFLEVVSG